MSKKFDVVAVTGTYTKDGVEKPVWKNCGAVFETPKGLSLKLDLVPVAGDGWFKLFEPKAQDAAPQKSTGPDDDLDLPF